MLAGREASGEEPSKPQILLGLLELVERDGAKSQRRLAGRTGTSPWVWSTPTSGAASRKVWSRSPRPLRGASPIT